MNMVVRAEASKYSIPKFHHSKYFAPSYPEPNKLHHPNQASINFETPGHGPSEDQNINLKSVEWSRMYLCWTL